MNSKSSFSVTWGRYARTLEYRDSEGQVVFTLDSGNKGDKSICLEHHSPESPRGPRYDIAFHQAKQFLESQGFEVEICDAATIDWVTVRAAADLAREKYIADGTLVVDSRSPGNVFSRLLMTLKRLFKS